VNLSWRDNSGNEAGFRIDRSTNGSTFATVTTVNANMTAYTDSGLVTSTTYSYRVSAFNSAGSSANSNTATVALVVPSAPTNLTADRGKHGRVTLKWNDNANNETAFQVERSTNGTAFAIIASTAVNSVNYTDSGLQRGQTYNYRVAAKNKVGLSSYSNVLTVTMR
jgi:titin